MRYFICLSAVLMWFCSGAVCAATVATDEDAVKILILHSYQPQERSYLMDKGLKETLSKHNRTHDIRVVHMDYNSLESMYAIYRKENWSTYSEMIDQERARLLEVVKSYRPDIAVICDDEVAHVMAEAINKMSIPIFFIGINEDIADASWYQKSNKDEIAGLIEWYPIRESIDMFNMMLPVKRVAMLSGDGFSSHQITKQFVKELKRANVQISGVYNLSRWDDWKSAVGEINRSSDLVWVLVPYHVYDNDGMEMGVTRIGKWLHDHLSIPSSGITDIHIRVGMFAAISPSTYDLGRESANQIIRYLNGVPLKTIGVTNNRYYDIDINAKTAKKLNIKIPDELIILANAGRSGKIRDKINTKH